MSHYLGAHMSIAGGVSHAIERGHSIDCTAIQVFTKNNRQWEAPPISEEEAARWFEQQEATGLNVVVSHAIYLINMASPKEDVWQRSLNAYIDELERAALLRIPGVVVHPGSHTGAGVERGVARVAEALDQAHRAVGGVMTYLEVTAGSGDSLGSRLEELAAIREAVAEPERVAYCFDTCHALAAGYEFRTPESYAALMDDWDHILGLSLLRCFHFNDSKGDLGSRVDRHTHIGEGHVGLNGFRFILNDPRFQDIPMLLETPKKADMKDDVRNLATLRGLVAGR